jgi:formate/nitrite transporter
MEARNPLEILDLAGDVAAAKAARPLPAQAILGFLAGAFIAFAAEGSTMAAFNLLFDPARVGLGRVLAGAVFGTGLMLVVLAGGELFTGNCLMVAGIMEGKLRAVPMLKSWAVVYAANFAGSLFVAALMAWSGLFASAGGLAGGMTIRIAAGKCALAFGPAFALGLLCNWLVCLAVWVSWAARDATGKILACFFVICLFITSGFEHSIANMYYIPAGIFARANSAWVAASGLSPEMLDALGWKNFFLRNLLPVTLGNIAGGAGMTAVLFPVALRWKGRR